MRWVKGILRGLVMAVLLVLCAVLFYVLVIMGDSPKVDIGGGENPPPAQEAGTVGALPWHESGMVIELG